MVEVAETNKRFKRDIISRFLRFFLCLVPPYFSFYVPPFIKAEI